MQLCIFGGTLFIITNTWVIQSRGVESHTQTSLIVDGLAGGKVQAEREAVRQLQHAGLQQRKIIQKHKLKYAHKELNCTELKIYYLATISVLSIACYPLLNTCSIRSARSKDALDIYIDISIAELSGLILDSFNAVQKNIVLLFNLYNLYVSLLRVNQK